jgi:hypothetical protein
VAKGGGKQNPAAFFIFGLPIQGTENTKRSLVCFNIFFLNSWEFLMFFLLNLRGFDRVPLQEVFAREVNLNH